MKKALKVLGYIFLVIIILVTGSITYAKFVLPSVGDAPNLKVDITPERVERGKYLANAVAVCMDCHSTRDWSKFAGPMAPGSLGKGGDRFGSEMGIPGTVHIKNITPYNLATWTDGEIYRAITTGVTKSGDVIFPIMPYKSYAQMDPEDVYDIIAYLRSLPAVPNEVPTSTLDFPVNFIIRTVPSAANPMSKPSQQDTVAWGKYLTTISACNDCHNTMKGNDPIPGMAFAGGRTFPMPCGNVQASNITPANSGIKNWTREMFIARFKAYADSSYQSPTLTPQDFNTPMPWMMLSKMSEEDLGAIYTYLQTVPAVENKVTKLATR
ncbi:cytochrome c [Chitinophaga skermanii]|uniref:Cytochrome c n=1 Tax=Chitinophaga skermanii TaxID=331697 RepID=A0A327Q9D5_9BACT|nr:c-type cytochrome [Chitinophaga skermanii]RAJ00494.1 cytochrome c [Chitinophaga skermanii]